MLPQKNFDFLRLRNAIFCILGVQAKNYKYFWSNIIDQVHNKNVFVLNCCNIWVLARTFVIGVLVQ